jgi:hypothetical protein
VVVKDRKGNPVTGLAPADFALLEDGRPQKITSFDHVSGTAFEAPPPSQGAVATEGGAASPDANAAPPLRRTYVIVFDQVHLISSAGRAMPARAEGLAADTGGFTVKNRHDLASGLRQIATETRNYYLLGYSSNRTQNEGKFRKIQVKVARKGVEVRARRGYYPRPPRGVPVSSSSSAAGPAGAHAHAGRILRPGDAEG